MSDIEKMETLPGHYQRSSQIQAPKKGIRLLKDRPNGDITSMYAQQRFSTFRSDHSGQKLTQDATSQTESPSTSLSLMCTQRQIVPCQNNIYKNTITTFNTAVTTSSPIVPRDRNTLVYFSEEIITTKNQQIHTVQSDGALSDGGVNTNSCFLTHSRSLQDFNSASEMALTPISLQLRQENLSKDELTPIFNIVAEEIGKEWQMLGSCLGLELKDIHKCESEYKDNLSMQALTMLNYWRKQKGRLATKNELIKCLKVRGRTDIAEQLENLQPDVQQP